MIKMEMRTKATARLMIRIMNETLACLRKQEGLVLVFFPSCIRSAVQGLSPLHGSSPSRSFPSSLGRVHCDQGVNFCLSARVCVEYVSLTFNHPDHRLSSSLQEEGIASLISCGDRRPYSLMKQTEKGEILSLICLLEQTANAGYPHRKRKVP